MEQTDFHLKIIPSVCLSVQSIPTYAASPQLRKRARIREREKESESEIGTNMTAKCQFEIPVLLLKQKVEAKWINSAKRYFFHRFFYLVHLLKFSVMILCVFIVWSIWVLFVQLKYS